MRSRGQDPHSPSRGISRRRTLGPARDLRLVLGFEPMDIYLPIAGQSVNALFIVILGFLVGVLSGMFGVGGGFLTTPLLIFYGIPPTVAVASASTQITGASVSGVMVHMRRGGVDAKMGAVMTFGGLLGSVVGAAMFRVLQTSGQIDVVVGSLYVVILASIGGLMLKDALVALEYVSANPVKAAPRHNRWVASLPLRWRFYSSGLYISPVAPLALGFLAGVLTVFLGIGGGFILVPAMIYLLGMPARIVIGTSLVMILTVSAATTMVHALTTRAVDIVLAGLLLVGGVIGAQYGALLTLRIKPDLLRLALSVIILLVAARMALGLAWHPDEIFSIEYLCPRACRQSCLACSRPCWSRRTSRCWCRTFPRARCRFATASPVRNCCYSERWSIRAGGHRTVRSTSPSCCVGRCSRFSSARSRRSPASG